MEKSIRTFAGRIVELDGRVATKWCDNAQAQWQYMQDLDLEIFPKMLETGTLPIRDRVAGKPWQYFSMERLYEPPPRTPMSQQMQWQLVRLRALWASPILYKHDENWVDRLGKYLTEKGAEPYLVTTWLPQVAARSERLPKVNIHGDATMENTMWRENYGLVLIDPLPDLDKIPAYKQVDLGKILQSVLGWEFAKHGQTPNAADQHGLIKILQQETFSLQDWNSVCFWCAVHLERIKPYTDDEKLLAWINGKIQELCDVRL